MTRPEGAAEVRDAAAISIGYAGATVLGGVLALLIGHFFGKTTRTDAFFAAYGLYWVALVFAHTLRLAAVPQLLHDDAQQAADRVIGAVLALGIMALIPMVLLSEAIGSVLVENDPAGTAPESLRTLWPALACQLLAGALAAILAVRREFLVIGFGYVAGGLISITAFVLLRPLAGIQAVPIALSISGASLALLLGLRLLTSGWRPYPPAYRRLGPLLEESRLLLLASAGFAASNLGYVICLAVASREGTGEATLYAYAYFAAALLVSMTAVSAALVRSTKALSSGTQETLSWANSLSTYRFALVVVLPVIALAGLLGKPIVTLLLGDAFSGDDATRLVVTLLSLSGWIFGSAASVLAIMLLLGRRAYRPVAAVSVGQLVLLLPLALVGKAVAGTPGIGAAQSLTMLTGTVILLALAFRSNARPLVKSIGAATLRGATAVAIATAPAFAMLIAFGSSVPVLLAAATCAIILLAGATALTWPAEARVLMSAVSERFHPTPDRV